MKLEIWKLLSEEEKAEKAPWWYTKFYDSKGQFVFKAGSRKTGTVVVGISTFEGDRVKRYKKDQGKKANEKYQKWKKTLRKNGSEPFKGYIQD